MAVLSKELWYPLGPLEAEAKALEEAIDFAWDVGIHDAHFECDSLVVFDVVRELSCPPVVISNIVSGTCLRMQDFCTVQVLHVRWVGNKLAHLLAQYVRDLDSYVIWIEENLIFTKSALAHDILNLSSSK